MRTFALHLAWLTACAPALPTPMSVTATCGDGLLSRSTGEACDDGNRVDTDGCLNNCQLAECGDGFVREDASVPSANEDCDDGNSNDRDACTNACQLARCGDGILRGDLSPDDVGYEACDDGNEFSGDLCTVECRLPRCGDGWRQSEEDCDDGNNDNQDDCSNACVSARCGDGIIQHWEACDDGPDGTPNRPDACRVGCIAPSCGDGIVDSGEACDDGDDLETNGCIACNMAVCGDGYLRTDLRAGEPDYEACDDGNEISTDACTTDCTEARCGDGVVWEGFERCDDGNEDPLDGCSIQCLLDDHSNRFIGATALTAATPVPGTFHFDSDLDTFVFQAGSSGVHRFETSELADEADPTCLLYTEDGRLMATSDDAERGNWNCSLEVALISDETVYLQIRHYRRNGRGSYRLSAVEPCGNGYLDELEVCDPTEPNGNPFACRADCQTRRTIGLGVQHGCALTENQTLCWGYNGTLMAGLVEQDSPQRQDCGYMGRVDCVSSPHPVDGFQTPLTNVTCTIDGICGVDERGVPYCWGSNLQWRGIGAATRQDAPICPADLDLGPCVTDDDCFGSRFCHQESGRCRAQDLGQCSGQGLPLSESFQTNRSYRGIAGGFSHLCAVRTNGTVDCWGAVMWNDVGARGYTGPNLVAEPRQVQGLENIVFTDSALDSNCALDAEGSVFCWGQNNRGQLGVAETDEQLSHPAAEAGQVGFSTRPIRVIDLPPVVDLDVGWVTVCAVTETGQLYCWGSSENGLLGRDLDDDCLRNYCRSGPELVTTPEPMVSVAVGTRHACAVGFSGRLYCWGSTANGSLGLGRDFAILGEIIELPRMVGRLNHVVEVSVSGGGNGNDSTHTCAKTQTPGTPARLYCWGANAFGQLGIGRLSDDPVPLPTRVY